MGSRGDGDHEVMKKIAMAAAGLSLLGLSACLTPGYGYNAYTGGAHTSGHGHGHAEESYYVHPDGSCVVPGAIAGGLAGLAAYALADEVFDWAGPINKDELILSGFAGAGVGGLIGANSYCPRYGY